MQNDSSLLTREQIASLCARLQRAEDALRAANPAQGAREGLAQSVEEIRAVRLQMQSAGGRAEGDAASDGIDGSVEKDRLERAASELKSGEFDVQG